VRPKLSSFYNTSFILFLDLFDLISIPFHLPLCAGPPSAAPAETPAFPPTLALPESEWIDRLRQLKCLKSDAAAVRNQRAAEFQQLYRDVHNMAEGNVDYSNGE
jgi:hypothetical protein